MRTKTLYPPVVVGWWFLYFLDCPDKARHDDFDVQEGRGRGFFILFSETEPISVLVHPVILTDVQCPMVERKKFTDLFRLEKVQISVFSVSLVNRYLRHG